ncbi:MAG TPA: methylase [Myxococcaceae bacterium]|nr:methylase [Myxococcaceae bacterium]
MGPEGAPLHPTKGRTAAGRLRLLDTLLRLHPPPSLTRPPAPGLRPVVVDLGFGETPVTSLELLETLRAMHLETPGVIAVEQASHRVAAARASTAEDTRLAFREGGFDLPVHPGEDVRWVRVMNVLRGYPLEAAREAHQRLGRCLPDEAWVWEGSADPRGHLLTCHLLRVRGGTLERVGLLFGTDFDRGFAPLQFRDWLPRDLRRSVRPGHPLHAFFAHWTAAFEAARGAGVQTSRERFRVSIRRLGQDVPGVDGEPELLHAGLLRWTPPGGIPD